MLGVLPGEVALGPFLAGGAATILVAGEAEARSRSSGGYSRPSVRTPSVSRSGSGGYRRPSAEGGPALNLPRGGGDLGLSRRGSAEALERYRNRSQSLPWTDSPSRRPDIGEPSPTGRRGWTPPPYATQSSGFGGLGNALMLWFLLDTLGKAGHADYFHDHQDDPSYRQWRAEADSRAASDPELRAKLNALDSQLAERSGQPRDPGTPPPDDVAAPGGDGGVALWPVALLALGFVVLWQARRRRTTAAGTPRDPAGRILRDRPGGAAAAPASPYRLGMTLTLDPAPFVLAGAATKVRAPNVSGDGTVGVEAVGRLEAGAVVLDRLYLPEGQGFLQVHRTSGAASGGAVDECRYFIPIDRVLPADAEDWAFWLDQAEGLIGWPTFETRDGKIYTRLWRPGAERVEPVPFTESRRDLAGTVSRRLSAMLYAAPLDTAPPAPDTEYVLVAAIEQAGEAWIEVQAGLDVDPASLSLP